MSGPSLGQPGPSSIAAHGWGWRHHGRKAFAVRDLDLRIGPGERVLLLGASGSGKSTLLSGLAGLLDDGTSTEPRDEGRLLVDGVPAGDEQLRGRVGLLLQDPQAQTVLARCGDDVAFGCENLGVPREQIWPRVDAALAAVGLDVARDRPTEHLSGGQRQRLALAGVVAMQPGLLLLDEPTANLDPAGAVEVREAVRSVLGTTGATLVVVEHDVRTWLDVVERIVVLEPGGGVRADGSTSEVLDRYGAQLAAEGVWVPGHPPEVPERRGLEQVGLGRDNGQLDPSGAVRLGEMLLSTTGLVVAPPGSSTPAARGVRTQVRAGECLAITGVNGAGKSTLALTLAGLLRPAAGVVQAGPGLREGARPRRLPRRERGTDGPWTWRSADLLARIGMVFQDPEHQFLTSTVRDELRHGPMRLGVDPAVADARADELLEQLRLTRLAEANPFTLSGGEKRRLSVATALATRPRVLVLDEPTFGQDRLTWTELVRLLAGLLDDGLAAVVVTHDDTVVAALADTRLELGRPEGGR